MNLVNSTDNWSGPGVVIKPLKYNIPITSLSCQPVDDFIQFCTKIISGNNNINVINCQNVIFTMANYHPKKMDEILRATFNELSSKINNQVDELYREDILSPQDFIDMYHDYEEKYKRLSNFLFSFDNLFYNEKHRYSQSKFIKNSAMYFNVICKCHNKDGQMSYIYQILNKLLDNEMDIKEVNELYHIFNFFEKNKSTVYPDVKDIPDNVFLDGVSKSLNNLIYTLIVEYSHIDDDVMKKDIDNDLNKLLSNINRNYSNHELFCYYYEFYFEKRLYSKYFSLELELKLINNMTHKDFCSLKESVMVKINDCNENQIFHIVIHKKPFVVAKISSKEFENFINPGDIVDLTVITPFIYRNITLDYKIDNKFGNVNIPLSVKLYLHIYERRYQNWNINRHLCWNHQKGHSIIEMRLNNKDYQFKMSFPQLYLIYQFNKEDRIPAIELSKLLNVHLRDLGDILNIFLTNKILVRDQNSKSNDPKVIIAINDNFQSEEERISLI